MAAERLSMREIREVLRQRWTLQRSYEQIARSVRTSLGGAWGVVQRAEREGLDWAAVEQLDDETLERRLYPSSAASSRNLKPQPDCAWIDTERRKPGVTLELLHVEYLSRNPGGYQYTQFCEIYRRWLGRNKLSMCQVHRAGEKTFVDYSGKKPHIIDPLTGQVIEVELFVGALGASSYTFAEATLTQRGPDWIASHIRLFSFLDGVTGAIVSDQLRSGVCVPCRYEPGIQRTYEDLARHYGTVILPARPRRPRDKAKVEVAVQVVQRWILARIRNETFFSLAALNERIAELLDDLNNRVMRRYGESRRQLFERLDKPALKPLPSTPFVYGEWKVNLGVNIDYHVQIDHRYYSVPFGLRTERVEAWISASTVEIFHKSRRVASHRRCSHQGGYTTDPSHMPSSHRAHLEWSPSRFIRWGAQIGPQTEKLVTAILSERPHPEQGYRSCLGILRLAKQYNPERLEAASSRAMAVGARSYRHVESILKHGLDRTPLPQACEPDRPALVHENVRGPDYYD